MAAKTEILTASSILEFITFTTIKLPNNKTITLTNCSKTFAILDGVIILCPCKYPFVTLNNGTTNSAVETTLITLAILSTELPPSTPPFKIFAIVGAKIIRAIKLINPKPIIIDEPILNARSLVLYCSKALYSLTSFDIATGIPDVDRFKKIA